MHPEHPSAGFGRREFEVVFVCTGNRARSPLAAEIFRRHSGDLPVAVKSVGTLDLGPVPALPQAVWAAGMLGIDLAPHRARPLLDGGLAAADLVVGFEPIHVAAAVVKGGAVRARAFLITELAELLGQIRTLPNRLPEHTIELAHAGRAGGPPSTLPVGDPVGGSTEDFRRAFEQISRLVAVIAVGLFGDPVVETTPASRRRP